MAEPTTCELCQYRRGQLQPFCVLYEADLRTGENGRFIRAGECAEDLRRRDSATDERND